MIRWLALFALFTMLAGCTPPSPAPSNPSPPVTTAGAGGDQNVQLVTLYVPNMHCPVMCWPKVKETLEAQPGVSEVVLAEQAKEDEIDDPRVTLTVTTEFDSHNAIRALTQAGFADARVE